MPRSDKSEHEELPSVHVNVDDAIKLLNWMVENDPALVQSVVDTRLPCVEATWHHPTIQVASKTVGDGPNQVDASLLGIMNGVFGTIKGGKLDGYGFISVIVDENGKVMRFDRTEVVIDELSKQKKT